MSSQRLIRYLRGPLWFENQSRVNSPDRFDCTHTIMLKTYLFWNFILNTELLLRLTEVLRMYFTYLIDIELELNKILL